MTLVIAHQADREKPTLQWSVGPGHKTTSAARPLVHHCQRAAPAPAGAEPLPLIQLNGGGQGLTGTHWRPGRNKAIAACAEPDGVRQIETTR